MVYNAFLLTGANLLLRLVSMCFQIYLSGKIGAAGIGLLQLTLSVSSLAMTAAMAGIRTATMYLTAEEIGSGRKGHLGNVLSACISYSILCSTGIAAAVWASSPLLAANWIRDTRVLPALRIFCAFLPAVCLVGVMTGFLTARGQVRALVKIEIMEQLISIGATVMLLGALGSEDPGQACTCVVAGASCASVWSLVAMAMLCRKETRQKRPPTLRRRLLHTALPLALADDLRMGISAAENLTVPRRLGLYSGSHDPLAAYGRVSGMVFPVLMFPAGLLFSLAELLIPELSRCAAGKRMTRIRMLTARSLRLATLYGLFAGGFLYLAAKPLGILLYGSSEAGGLLRRFSILAPMLYTDAITDAAVKGMGQQVACVRYNTFTSTLDVIFLWFLLPRYGLDGYFFSFVVTHVINFILSIRRLRKATGFQLNGTLILRSCLVTLLTVILCLQFPGTISWHSLLLLGLLYGAAFFILGICLHIVKTDDLKWLIGLLPIDIHRVKLYNERESNKKGQ